MPVDASIFNAFATRPKSIADYDQEAAQAENTKIAQQSNLLGLQAARQKNDEYTRGLGEQATIRNALTGLGAGATDEQRIAALKSTGLPSGFAQADALDKSRLERLKTGATVGKDNAEADAKKLDSSIKAHEYHVQLLGAVNSPQDALAWAQEGLKSGVFTPEQYQRGLQNLQQAAQNPQTFAQWKQQALQGGMSVTQQLAAQQAATTQAENARHNGATEQNAAGQLKVSQGQLGVAQGNLGLRGKELALNQSQPKGVIVQTEAGPVLADPRTGDALPVTMGGKPLAAPGPKLKDIPPSANKAILENSQNVTKVQQAIDLLEGKQVGVMEGDKNATGVKGYLPNGILNRVDPKGVDTRAAISDIGSLILHDRSGAAVTASETPRLLPFIPLSTDDNATAAKKLKRFKQLYEAEANGLNEQYGEGSGYRGNLPKPAGPAPDTSAHPPEIKSLLDKYK